MIFTKKIKGKRVLLDTNILVHNTNKSVPEHVSAESFINLGIGGFYIPVIAHQNIVESIRVLSHPRRPMPLGNDEILIQIRYLKELAMIISPTKDTLQIFTELVSKYRIVGDRLHDTYLVATAIANEIEFIATYDTKGFYFYEEIESFSPSNLSWGI